jgi:hypothetical protein
MHEVTREPVTIPEWGNARQVAAYFGLGKATLKKLVQDGHIVSTLVKGNPQAHKGVRLYDLASIRKYLRHGTNS